MLKGRTMFLRLVSLSVLLLLMGRLAWVQVAAAAEITRRAEEMRLIKKQVQPVRGAILDRAGRYLAVSVPFFAVIANPLLMKAQEEQRAAAGLAPYIELGEQEILARLQANSETGWLPLADELSFDEAQRIEALHLPGIVLEHRLRRSYPQGFTANHLLGYVDAENKGQYGLEIHYDKDLSGTSGFVLAEFTNGNTPIEGTIKQELSPQPGHHLVLTIDASLQQLAEAKLEEVVKQTKANRALVMAMNAHTGEILVMAMRPAADPGDRSTWGDPVDFNRLINWSTSPLPPGSIFKTITLSAALEEGAITTDSTFIDTGEVRIDGWRITNWDSYLPPKPEPMSVAELMQRSSNVGMIGVGERLGPEKFVKYLKGFGFMDKTGIDLPYEKEAIGLTDFEEKRAIDWVNMYIGQYLEITPVQMLTAVAAIANGGYLVQPHLVQEIRDPSGQIIKTASTDPRRQVISQATAKEVQEILVGVIEEGTAGAAKPQGYTVGGKTGTAQKFEGGRMKERMLADFVGFAPAVNPQVVMLVMVDEPEGEGYGGIVAAPIFRELMPQVMAAVGIPPDSPAALGKETAPPKAIEGTVPNTLWLNQDRALERLAEAGLKGKLIGSGTLVGEQKPQAGSLVKGGSEVMLTLVPAVDGGENVRVPEFIGLSLSEAHRLATEVGLTLKPGGTGFVVSQDRPVGSLVLPRQALSVRLAPRNLAPRNLDTIE